MYPGAPASSLGAWPFPELPDFPSAAELLERVNALMTAAGSALNSANEARRELLASEVRWLRDLLIETWAAIRNEAATAAREGASAAGDVLLILGARIGQAVHAVAGGIGQAFRAFWGFPPWVFPLGAALFGLLILGGGLFAILDPGAQALARQGLRTVAPLARGGGGLLGGAGSALVKLF